MMRFLNRWRRDRGGVSAVEFAFVAPVLIVAYFGVAELCGAMLAQRKAGHVASEIGDLVAQYQTVHDIDVTDFWAVGTAVMSPLDTSTLKMRVTSINANATATVFTVGWSDDNGAGLTKYAPNTVLSDPSFASLIPASSSVIMSETQYTYASPVSIIVKNAVTLNSKFYLSPRQTTIIVRSSP